MSFISSLTPKNQTSYQIELPNFNLCLPDISQSYYISGQPGNGKTTLALNLIKKWIQEINQPDLVELSLVKFITFQDLIFKARETFQDADVGFQARMSMKFLKDVTLLVIDDIGTEKKTEFIDQLTYELVNHRYENQLQTVFTSNYSVKDISERYDPRIASRIVEMAGAKGIIKLSAVDFRKTVDLPVKTNFEQFKIKTFVEPNLPLPEKIYWKRPIAETWRIWMQMVTVTNPELIKIIKELLVEKNCEMSWKIFIEANRKFKNLAKTLDSYNHISNVF